MTKPGNSDPDDAAEPATTPEKAAAEKPAKPAARKPVMPTAREAAAETTGKPLPGPIRWGFYLVVTGAVVGVLGAVYLLANQDVLAEQQMRIMTDMTRTEAEQVVSNAVWTLVIINVIFGVFQALFAYKAREGQRRARLFLTIATVLILLFHYLLVQTLFGLIAALVAAIGVALYHLPVVRDFYPPRPRLK
ncbi:MAG TPA: hypothetical protein VHH15_02120 [Actinophytocola sp.]|nr:hypothetical protein [Actinophytocola sp.]